jgi:serine/threonine-protein kinase
VPELAEGTAITDDLVLSRPLAEGNGNVWIAAHKRLSTDVVVKLLPREQITSPEARVRFTREVRAGVAIDSEHVVKRLDTGLTEDGVPFIALELLEGEDLRTHLGRVGPLSPTSAVSIVTQVAKALTAVHAAGIVHRDVKPENIFLCRRESGPPHVKLLDFGVAKTMKAKSSVATSAGIVVGTPHYMSPEQMSGGTLDAQVDLWALAVLTFEALCGHRPFPGDDLQAIGMAAIVGPRPKISTTEPAFAGLDEFFQQAFAKERAKRFADAASFADAFAGAVASLAEPNVPSSRAARTRSLETFALKVKPQRRMHYVALGIATFVLVAAILIAIFIK